MPYFSGLLPFRIVNDDVMMFVLKKIDSLEISFNVSYLQHDFGRYIKYLYFTGVKHGPVQL